MGEDMDNKEDKFIVWIFGNWKPRKPDMKLDPGVEAAVKFLRGQTDLGLPENVATGLRGMFSSQERWRDSVESGLKRLIAHFQEKRAKHIPGLQVPTTDPVEQAHQWRSDGAYKAHAEDADHVMHVIENGWLLEGEREVKHG